MEYGEGKEMKVKLAKCNLCPRNCGVERIGDKNGYCGVSNTLKVARAALHFWEEPCISGVSGSGTVFFSGCQLRCGYCQNYQIASGEVGEEISVDRLVEIFYELKAQGANNINLVTPGHYVPQIAEAIERVKGSSSSARGDNDTGNSFDIPFVYNTGSYEKAESLRRLDGLIDIYLPDFKYADADLAATCSNAPDYFEVATAAIDEMLRQVKGKHGSPFGFKPEHASSEANSQEDEVDLMTHGVIIRHLLLPGCMENSKKAVEHIYNRYGDDVFLSIMNQYTPCDGALGIFSNHREINGLSELYRKVTADEYDELIDFALEVGVENGFMQEEGTAEESFIPPFDLSGVF